MDIQDFAPAARALLAEESEVEMGERTIEEGAAMERLLQNSDFQIYRRAMERELALLIRKSVAVSGEEARCMMQGALIHHVRISKLPEKRLERAAFIVAKRREDSQEAIQELEVGGER